MTLQLSDRKKRILKAVIDDYIETAEPVGSKALVDKWRLEFSPATIRNEMSELEDMGYLEKPHTSAGRIPSHKGYRLYVNELMNMYRLSSNEAGEINRILEIKRRELDHLIAEAGKLISELTNYTALAISPRILRGGVLRFDIIPIDMYSFVIVTVISSGMVKSKLLHLPLAVSEGDAHLLSGILNKFFVGIPLDHAARNKFIEIASSFGAAPALYLAIANFMEEIFTFFEEQDVYLEGTSKLLNYPEYHDIDKAQKLLEFISDRDNIKNLSTNGDPGLLHITIGSENGVDPLNDASVVYSTYKIGGGARGIIGIIGPTRMDYPRVAASLKLFSKKLNDILSEIFAGDENE